MEVVRTLTRIYVNELDQAVSFYEKVFGETGGIRYEVSGLEMVEVGSFLLVSGDERALRFVQFITATIFVDSLEGYRSYLIELGAKISRDIQPFAGGKNMVVKHPDGLIVEYIEFETGEVMQNLQYS